MAPRAEAGRRVGCRGAARRRLGPMSYLDIGSAGVVSAAETVQSTRRRRPSRRGTRLYRRQVSDYCASK